MRRFASLLLLLFAAPAAWAQPFTTQVIRVPSGDTLIIRRNLVETTVRLYGVDAPDAGQPLFEEALRFTESRALNHLLRFDVRGEAGSTLTAEASFLENGGSLGAALVRAGLARWDEQAAPQAPELTAAEQEARRAGRGLWASAIPARAGRPVVLAPPPLAGGAAAGAPANYEPLLDNFLPDRGATELQVQVDLSFEPIDSIDIGLRVLPYLSRNLQAGGELSYRRIEGEDGLDFTLWSLALGARYNFVGRSRTVPFVSAFAGYARVDIDIAADDTFTYGAEIGVKQFLNRNNSLDFAFIYRDYSENGIEEDFGFRIGISTYLR